MCPSVIRGIAVLMEQLHALNRQSNGAVRRVDPSCVNGQPYVSVANLPIRSDLDYHKATDAHRQL